MRLDIDCIAARRLRLHVTRVRSVGQAATAVRMHRRRSHAGKYLSSSTQISEVIAHAGKQANRERATCTVSPMPLITSAGHLLKQFMDPVDTIIAFHSGAQRDVLQGSSLNTSRRMACGNALHEFGRYKHLISTMLRSGIASFRQPPLNHRHMLWDCGSKTGDSNQRSYKHGGLFTLQHPRARTERGSQMET